MTLIVRAAPESILSELAASILCDLAPPRLSVAGNSHFTTTFEYEVLNQIVRRTREVGTSADVVTEYEHDANRNRTLVRHGEALIKMIVTTENNVYTVFFKEGTHGPHV